MTHGGPATLPSRETQEQPQRPARWPALDGLRAIAILAVIGLHVGILPGGYLGVDVFFVLSGFLITSLLISEWDERGGSISFRRFYARRVLRILPALGCVLAVAALVAAIILAVRWKRDTGYADATLSGVPWALLFAGNVDQVLHPGGLPLGALGPTWSLAVEEQFYLLWPALFVLLMRRRLSRSGLALAFGCLAVAEMIYRLVAASHGWSHDRLYFGTDTHSDGLLLGCALAFWLSARQPGKPAPSRLAAGLTWGAATVIAVVFLAGAKAWEAGAVSAAVLGTAVVLAALVSGRAPAALDRALRARWAVWIGRRSYGLYLWHGLILAFTEALISPYTGIFPAGGWRRVVWSVALVGAVAVSFIVTDLSYRRVELPALRLKRRFRG